MKSYRPSLRETWDKRPLGRDPDRSWCHRHTTSMLLSTPMEPLAATKKALHYCIGDSRFSRVSRRLLDKSRTFHLAFVRGWMEEVYRKNTVKTRRVKLR